MRHLQKLLGKKLLRRLLRQIVLQQLLQQLLHAAAATAAPTPAPPTTPTAAPTTTRPTTAPTAAPAGESTHQQLTLPFCHDQNASCLFAAQVNRNTNRALCPEIPGDCILPKTQMWCYALVCDRSIVCDNSGGFFHARLRLILPQRPCRPRRRRHPRLPLHPTTVPSAAASESDRHK